MAERRRSGWLLEHWRGIALVLAAVVMANLLLHFLFIRRLVEVSGDREAILAGRRADLATLGRDLNQLERTVSKLACTRSDLSHVLDDLLSAKGERMVAILRELSDLARDMRIDPGRVSYAHSERKDSRLVRFTASFSFEAPYSVLHDFIRRIESSSNFLFIEQISLTGARGQGGSLRLQIRVATWFQSPDLARLDATFGQGGGGRP